MFIFLYIDRIGIAVVYWIFPIDATITKLFKNKEGKACGFKLEKELHDESLFFFTKNNFVFLN